MTGPLRYACGTCSSQKDAAIAASSHLFADDASKFSVRAAPPPEAVNCTAVWTSRPKRVARRWLAALLYAAAIIFPIGFFVGSHLAVIELPSWKPRFSPWSGVLNNEAVLPQLIMLTMVAGTCFQPLRVRTICRCVADVQLVHRLVTRTNRLASAPKSENPQL